MKWTKEQEQVINERGSNILVSAAAGSGKTAVLCERIIERLCDRKEPLSLDRLIVMTFTRAAAEEMRERISRALTERIEAEEGKLYRRPPSDRGGVSYSDLEESAPKTGAPEPEAAEGKEGPEAEGELSGHKLLTHLKRQRLLLRNADISTIDSLCQKLIREYYQELDIDPSFRVAEDGELRLLRADVLSELLEERYDEGSPEFLRLSEGLSGIRGDEKLSELILKTYEFIQSDPWPERFLKRLISESEAEMEGDISELAWFVRLIAYISSNAKEQYRELSLALSFCDEDDGPANYREGVTELLSFMGRLDLAASEVTASAYDELYKLIHGFVPSRLKPVRGKDIDPYKKDRAKQIIDGAKDWIKELKGGFFALPKELMLSSQAGGAAYIRELLMLTRDFSERFAEAKRDKNIVDFGDLEHLCLSVLYKEGEKGMEPSEIADELSRHTSEILIDEYQDSNLVQEELISALSAERFGRPDVFMVGDVKQSIYRFRLARPELFMSKYEAYEDGQAGVRIELNKNFRSRGEVIDAANDVFSAIMQKELGGIEYDEKARLYQGLEPIPDEPETAGKKDASEPEAADKEEHAGNFGGPEAVDKEEHAENCGRPEASEPFEKEASVPQGHMKALSSAYKTELCVIETDGENTEETEARFIAERIRELVGDAEGKTGLKVKDKESGELRTARYGDIAILLRAPGSRARTYVDTLQTLGIPAYAETSTGYFSAPEVEVILSLLDIIDDPRQDIPLAAVMRSAIGGFSDGELALISSAYSDYVNERSLMGELLMRDFYDAVVYTAGRREEHRELSDKCSAFLSFIERYRELSDILPVSRLLDLIYHETGYLDLVSLQPLGRTRMKNLNMLMRRAENFSEGGERSVFDFVRYIEMLKRYNGDYGEENAVSEADDIVHILSIHRSKGLEYPIVFLSDCARTFNRQDSRDSVLMDAELGLGMDYIDLKDRIRYPGLKRTVLKQKAKEESLAEELRILYVAMTRAREKLIITAALENAAEGLGKCYVGRHDSMDEGLSRLQLMSASSYLELILLSGAAAWGSIELRHRAIWELSDESIAEEADRRRLRQRLSELDIREVPDEAYLSRLSESINAVYPYMEETKLRPKVSVSELKEAMEQAVSGKSESDKKLSNAPAAKTEGIGTSPEDGYDLDDDAMDLGLEELLQLGEGYSAVTEVRGTSEDKKRKAASAGTAFHRFMELLDFGRKGSLSAEDFVGEELGRIEASGLMKEEELELLDISGLRAFMESRLFSRMQRAAEEGLLWREQRFMAAFPASELQPSGSDAPQLLQGVIDAYFEEDGELVIVDYKTDRLYEEEAFFERYGIQLGLYRKALEKLSKKRVKECLIYSTALNRELMYIFLNKS